MAIQFSPHDLGLPVKFKQWKGQQAEIIEKIVLSDKDIFLLDAPTGSGKSIIGVAASYIWRTNWLTTKRLMGEEVSPKKVIYVTRTKQLQDQLLEDFPQSRTVKGRQNYPCLLNPKKFPDFTADDCPHDRTAYCDFKLECPYLLAKQQAQAADLAILNESYYLAEINGPGAFSNADFVILDEVDSFENALMNHISMNITQSVLDELKCTPPDNSSDWISWMMWWNSTNTKRKDIQYSMQSRQALLPSDKWTDKDIKENRRFKRIANFNHNLDIFMGSSLRQIIDGDFSNIYAVSDMFPKYLESKIISGKETPFIVQEHQDKTGQITRWELKPISVRNFARQRLWNHGRHFLGMSGTILSPAVLARELGIESQQYEYQQITSPYDVKNRPVFFWPVANMRKANMDSGEALPKLLNGIQAIIDKYPNVKMLIHTASYQVASAIINDQDKKGNRRIITHDADNRIEQLDYFKLSKDPLIMVSPSFDRGVDLPDDQCRCIIIAKIPYMNLGDRQVSARLKAPGGDQWYVFKAIQTLMQMTGRGVRNEHDYCDTYILDQQFTGLLARTKQYIPQWWMESVHRIEELP